MTSLLIGRRAILGGGAVALALPAGTKAVIRTVSDPYRALLQSWMDGLVAHQVHGTGSGRTNGGFLCPACSLVHGRSGDAVYPLLAQARVSGDMRYVAAAQAVHDWSEANTSRADGSWVNDAVLSAWKGITVFRVIAIAEALHRHGELLPTSVRDRWRARISAAMPFLDRFITIDTGNINYPVSASYAYALAAVVLGTGKYATRGRALAHESLSYFTERKLLFGEGRPQNGVTPKGCRPVDLGYNVEESLPALALYARLTNDQVVEDVVVASLSAHLEFMLPDGAWDNSWGSRNYKWTYWGSRTSDGCHGAYALLADRDLRFGEAASRNLELMRRATADGLLAGGPDYRRAGYPACIHHGMSHAKGLATVIDAAASGPAPSASTSLPRDRPYGLRSWPEIDTHLVAVGDWRATVTGYDFDYLATAGGGHATGGTLTLLHHRQLGPIVAAGMVSYKVVEVGNQQVPFDDRHRSNVPGLYLPTGDGIFLGAADAAAVVSARRSSNGVEVSVAHRPTASKGVAQSGSEAPLRLTYAFETQGLTIGVDVPASRAVAGSYFSLPLICTNDDDVAPTTNEVAIKRKGGVLIVRSAAGLHVERNALEFNLAPGFQFVEVRMPLLSGRSELTVRYAN